MTDQVNLGLVWAKNGSNTDPGTVDYLEGWVEEIPTHNEFNFLLNALDVNTLALAEKGSWVYQTNIDYQAGATARIAGVVYYCKAANGPASLVVDPATDTNEDYWSLTPYFGSDFSAKTVKGGLEVDSVVPRTNNTWVSSDITMSNFNSILSMKSTGAGDNWLLGNIEGKLALVNVGSAANPDARDISLAAAGTYQVYSQYFKPLVADVAGAVPEAPTGGKQYARKGTSTTTGTWVEVTSTTVQAEPPPPVLGSGAGWYNLVDGQFYLDINDGDSSQWVPANPPQIPELSAAITSYDDSANGIGDTVQEALDTVALRSNPNLLINGDFRPDLWQRGDTFATGLGDHYTADRWSTVDNCAVSLTQNAPEGFTSSSFVEASGGAKPLLRQAIELDREGGAGELYIGQTVTISGWIRATNHTPEVSIALQFRDGIVDAVNSVVDLGVTDIYTVQAQNIWEYFEYTHTITAAPNSTNLAYVLILRSETADEGSRFAGLKLELGSVATPYQTRPIGEELALCQRYYEVLRCTTGNYAYVSHAYTSLTSQRWFWNFSIGKRAVPTMIVGAGGWAGSVPEQYQSRTGFFSSGTGIFYPKGTGVDTPSMIADAEL